MFIWLGGSVYQVNFFETATQVHKGKICIKNLVFLKKVILRLISFFRCGQSFLILKISQQLRPFILPLYSTSEQHPFPSSSLVVNTRALILRQLSKDHTRNDTEGTVKLNKMVKRECTVNTFLEPLFD